jgi:hypothetical protein
LRAQLERVAPLFTYSPRTHCRPGAPSNGALDDEGPPCDAFSMFQLQLGRAWRVHAWHHSTARMRQRDARAFAARSERTLLPLQPAQPQPQPARKSGLWSKGRWVKGKGWVVEKPPGGWPRHRRKHTAHMTASWTKRWRTVWPRARASNW